MIRDKAPPIPDQVLGGGGPDRLRAEWSLPGFISMFLPEFPHRAVPGHQHFQVLGYIAKGSFGPILKVKDKAKQKTYAVKVIPKSEILRLGVLEQSKEEVIVQRQVRHPFVHDLQDCWQTQRHLYIMCDYCSTGDLYTYWVMIGQFSEDAVRVFAAELGCALGFLHDVGIIHRDVKMENILLTDQGHLRLADFGLSRRLERGGRAFTICGTIQYMAPEVLSGGPYSHAADWWSLGILLFSLVTGKFPVLPEPDHYSMLRRVRCFPYDIPLSFSPPLALLITELLCKTPTRRLRTLDRFKRQTFFHGATFDLALLQRRPVEVILALRERPDRPAKARRGLTLSLQPLRGFDYDTLLSPAGTPDTHLDDPDTHTPGRPRYTHTWTTPIHTHTWTTPIHTHTWATLIHTHTYTHRYLARAARITLDTHTLPCPAPHTLTGLRHMGRRRCLCDLQTLREWRKVTHTHRSQLGA
ncbi:ribosomal protein S6 kinase-related protein-like [Oncorhynchus keta]|uniref:ribosomal protein S6 kinase-related protein-like n=1 Tax=Oncorhynchus keta TaxID=8018 RepID=UPI00227A1475|nr:ribosomal protein S6 kinase-related protein-like [Oncorhynchus keta]XP_052372064.1 ribosomal protein S6 kinase-related protein-like [Oncorhynchus keta]